MRDRKLLPRVLRSPQQVPYSPTAHPSRGREKGRYRDRFRAIMHFAPAGLLAAHVSKIGAHSTQDVMSVAPSFTVAGEV